MSPTLASKDVSDRRLADPDLLSDGAMSQTSRAKFKDLREFLRRHSSAVTPPEILTMSDGFKMLWTNAGWDAA